MLAQHLHAPNVPLALLTDAECVSVSVCFIYTISSRTHSLTHPPLAPLSSSTKAIPLPTPKRLRSLILALLLGALLRIDRRMADGRRILADLTARATRMIEGTLRSGISPTLAPLLDRLLRERTALRLEPPQPRLFLLLGLVPCRPVGVDRLLREVVCPAAGDAEHAPA